MKTVRLTMAQALVRFLENQYIAYDGIEHPFVEGVIMLPGHGNVVGLGQALGQEAHRMHVWQGKNEQGMAHTAVAFARQCKRKKIIAVTSSVGPGAANMVTAAATATANNIPVLILPGDVYFGSVVVDDLDDTVVRHHDIGGLNVSMNDRRLCAVQELKAIADLRQNIDARSESQGRYIALCLRKCRFSILQKVVQRSALDQFLDHYESLAVFPISLNACHILVAVLFEKRINMFVVDIQRLLKI